MSELYYFEDEHDLELAAAWERLRTKTGSLDGWQYRGSGRTPEGWIHDFRNRRLLEEAETEEDAEAAVVQLAASENWQPVEVRAIPNGDSFSVLIGGKIACVMSSDGAHRFGSALQAEVFGRHYLRGFTGGTFLSADIDNYVTAARNGA